MNASRYSVNARTCGHEVIEPFAGKCWNATTDNFFTSLKLSEELKAKKTNIVGNMNRIRSEIPNEVKTIHNAQTLY